MNILNSMATSTHKSHKTLSTFLSELKTGQITPIYDIQKI